MTTRHTLMGHYSPCSPLTTPHKAKARIQSQLARSTCAVRATAAKWKTWLQRCGRTWAHIRRNTWGWPFLILTFFYECGLNTNQQVICSRTCMLNTLNRRNQLSCTRLWGRNSDLKILFGSSCSQKAVHIYCRWKHFLQWNPTRCFSDSNAHLTSALCHAGGTC